MEQSFKSDLTSDEEIITYIKSLKNNKSNGPFSISNKLFKKFKKPLSTPLTLLINLTFTKGKFPDILKIGKIFPIHKKNCKTNVSNYRPILLLSNISKIIEKLLMIEFICILKITISFIHTNLDLEQIIQQITP